MKGSEVICFPKKSEPDICSRLAIYASPATGNRSTPQDNETFRIMRTMAPASNFTPNLHPHLLPKNRFYDKALNPFHPPPSSFLPLPSPSFIFCYKASFPLVLGVHSQHF
ncbi:hypothetical protein RRG08_036473 [Elysia crispata]|uniref:Uncharacterized protein n=1 Tax=Elysia crispata TaxID=231223 RepID=A0AAE0ZK01_9GAST|nr:hypothetical protein RRG08_036473 [Elysia crispata]